VQVDHEDYTSIGIGDYFELTITSYENGIANGTFFGRATSGRGPAYNIPPITITNVVIKNAKIYYR